MKRRWLVVACAVILLGGELGALSWPATAQTATKKGNITKELAKRRDAGDCKVTYAGFQASSGGPSGYIEALCPDSPTPVFAHVPRGQEQAILSVALTAISTGRPVIFTSDNSGNIQLFFLVAPK